VTQRGGGGTRDGAPPVPDVTDNKYMEKSYRKAAEVMKKPGVPSLLIAVGIPLIAGIIVGLVYSPSGAWYSQLEKPWWNPPGFLFGAAWSVLYPVMGLASWLVWADGGFQRQGYPLSLYGAQLVLNLAPYRGKRVEALNRIEEFKSVLSFHVTHFIVLLEVFANKTNTGCTFFSSSASTDCYLRAL
jgi:hypothetical protein